ncbi:hypothetical protein P3T23_007646 [Paraburkholderia sp. GAS448]
MVPGSTFVGLVRHRGRLSRATPRFDFPFNAFILIALMDPFFRFPGGFNK